MDQTLEKIKEFLSSSKNIGIIAPKDSNVDQMAAALSLFLSLKASGRQVFISSPTAPLVELSHLVGIDKVKTQLGEASGDLVVSFPYREGEIEKVSYTLEDGFLNIVVKAGEMGFSFDQKDVRYQRPSSSSDLLFSVGAARISDLGNLFDPQALKDTKIVNIDNNPQNQGFGDLVLVSTRLSSVSEQVANLLFGLGLPLDSDISQNLLDGIKGATNNFQSPNTSSLAFEMAGVLMRNGAKRESEVREMASTAFSKQLQGLYGEKPPMQSQTVQSQRPIQAPVQNPLPGQQDQSQPANQTEDFNNPPSDWLTPKIYKGSTNF